MKVHHQSIIEGLKHRTLLTLCWVDFLFVETVVAIVCLVTLDLCLSCTASVTYFQKIFTWAGISILTSPIPSSSPSPPSSGANSGVLELLSWNLNEVWTKDRRCSRGKVYGLRVWIKCEKEIGGQPEEANVSRSMENTCADPFLTWDTLIGTIALMGPKSAYSR